MLTKNTIKINKRSVGKGFPVYIIAEMSANHHQNFEEAGKIIRAAAEAGADAVKIQTYTADTMTIDCSNKYFKIGKGTVWEGKGLYELYKEAYTPWEWQPELKKIAEKLGMDLFSTPFDASSVEFLEKMKVPVYKIASFELTDIPLLKKVARTGKPVIISTGMSTVSEINEAIKTLKKYGSGEIVLLKCTSAYPSLPEEMNLNTIADMIKKFKLPVGLSDHSLETAIPVAALGLGACVIEKHFTLSRKVPGPDVTFSLEPDEFREMVRSIRIAEKALGKVSYKPSSAEKHSRVFRRSVFAVEDIKKGEKFTEKNIRVIRPSYGMHPRFYDTVLGKKALCSICRGTPLKEKMIG
ncbi:MAG: pseudaminic acid synthase [Lentisphaerae bacterium GWF2_44_16]|nr:MAG: pseudaminic acid synthase [Lentisphaerae bacterium GWF2_44_16]